jgi:hypothetical protein
MTLRFLPETPADLAASMLACDYHAGPPRWLTADALLVDVECAAEMICPECGAAGGACHPYHRTRPARYVCYSVCRCGHWQQV